MADTPSKTTSKTPDAKPASTSGAGAPLADDPIPMKDGRIVPTPGDVRTEPVATAEQSHVAGRVGPRTIGEDATSAQPLGDDGAEVMPGAILADTPEGTGPVPIAQPEDPTGEALNRLVERVERERGPVAPVDGGPARA